MLVREAIEALKKMPQDHELLDEFAETVVTGFYKSTYDDDSGIHEYTAVRLVDFEEEDDDGE